MTVERQAIIDFARALAGASVEEKPLWEATAVVVGRKLFAIVGRNPAGEEIMTVKGDPLSNAELVRSTPAVTAGYYMNKKHWISVAYGRPEVAPELLQDLLRRSHDLVSRGPRGRST